jgi:hypothetical protein
MFVVYSERLRMIVRTDADDKIQHCMILRNMYIGGSELMSFELYKNILMLFTGS